MFFHEKADKIIGLISKSIETQRGFDVPGLFVNQAYVFAQTDDYLSSDGRLMQVHINTDKTQTHILFLECASTNQEITFCMRQYNEI